MEKRGESTRSVAFPDPRFCFFSKSNYSKRDHELSRFRSGSGIFIQDRQLHSKTKQKRGEKFALPKQRVLRERKSRGSRGSACVRPVSLSVHFFLVAWKSVRFANKTSENRYCVFLLLAIDVGKISLDIFSLHYFTLDTSLPDLLL